MIPPWTSPNPSSSCSTTIPTLSARPAWRSVRSSSALLLSPSRRSAPAGAGSPTRCRRANASGTSPGSDPSGSTSSSASSTARCSRTPNGCCTAPMSDEAIPLLHLRAFDRRRRGDPGRLPAPRRRPRDPADGPRAGPSRSNASRTYSTRRRSPTIGSCSLRHRNQRPRHELAPRTVPGERASHDGPPRVVRPAICLTEGPIDSTFRRRAIIPVTHPKARRPVSTMLGRIHGGLGLRMKREARMTVRALRRGRPEALANC